MNNPTPNDTTALTELRQAASEFCQLFDAWITSQPERVALSSAVKYGPEYQRMHELLTRLNERTVTK